MLDCSQMIPYPTYIHEIRAISIGESCSQSNTLQNKITFTILKTIRDTLRVVEDIQNSIFRSILWWLILILFFKEIIFPITSSSLIDTSISFPNLKQVLIGCILAFFDKKLQNIV
jgi:hypothetical protein